MDVRMPDGTIVQNVPDGVTQQDLLARYQAFGGGKPTGNPDRNLGGTLQLGVPFTGARLDTGVKIPPDLEAGIVGAGKTTARILQGVNPFADKAQITEENRLYQPLAEAHPKSTMAGETLPYLAATSLPAMIAMAAAEYGTPEERAARAAFAAGGGVAAKGVARLFGPKSMAPAAAGAENFGIPLRAAQTTDSKPVQITDAVLQNLPISSGVINRAKDASFQAFNRRASNTFGEDAAQITPELLGGAKERIGGTIGDIAGRNSIGASGTLFKNLQAVQQRAAQELTPEEARIVNSQIQNVWNAVDPQTGAIPGTLYKSFQSRFGEIGKNRGGTISSIMHDLRAAMRNAMTESVSKEDAAAWLKANEQYFNLQQVANAAKATPGSLSPSQLLTQVNRAQTASKFGGGNELADLARFAKPTLGDKIPTSGTAERLLYQRLISSPLTTAGAIAGAGYGLDQAGVNPYDAVAGGLLTYALARGMAGKPASELARKLLTQGGGLLGIGLAPQ